MKITTDYFSNELASNVNTNSKENRTSKISFNVHLKDIEKSIENIYSQRTAFSGGSYTIDAQNIQKVLNSLSKDYSKIENLKPTDISYEDYKKLTHNTVEVMFSDNKEKYKDAVGLLNLSQLIDDDILNKIYFDNEIKIQNGEEGKDYSSTLLYLQPLHIEDNSNLIFDADNILNQLSVISSKSQKKYENFFTTKDKLFLDFDKFKKYYEDTKENWTDAVDMNEVFKNMDEIKELYTKKVQENNAILNNYTRNTKEKVI